MSDSSRMKLSSLCSSDPWAISPMKDRSEEFQLSLSQKSSNGLSNIFSPAFPNAECGEDLKIPISTFIKKFSESEIELNLRGSLLYQQQRKIMMLEEELRDLSKLPMMEKITNKDQDSISKPDTNVKLKKTLPKNTKKATSSTKSKSNKCGTNKSSSTQSRYWTPEEHQLFLEALELFGPKDVKSIAKHVRTRSSTQVRTHAQKFNLRLKKEADQKAIESREGKPVTKSRSRQTAMIVPEDAVIRAAGLKRDLLSQASGISKAYVGSTSTFGK